MPRHNTNIVVLSDSLLIICEGLLLHAVILDDDDLEVAVAREVFD